MENVRPMNSKEINAAISRLKKERNTQKEGRTKSGRRIKMHHDAVKTLRLKRIASGELRRSYDGFWIMEDKFGNVRVQRPHRSAAEGRLKKQSSKNFRRITDDMPSKGNYYRKTFDYWWKLY